MSILKNFVNPWGLDTGVLDTSVLDTDVLDTSILNQKVENDTSSANGISVSFSSESSKKAFKAFFDTVEGKKFIGHFAKERQTVNGYTFGKNGKYYVQKIDLKYYDGDFGETNKEMGGITEGGMNGGLVLDGRLKLSVKLNTTPIHSSLIEKVATIAHETLLHVYEYALDFMDNKKIDYSHDEFYKKTENNSPTSRHHLKFHYKKGVTTTHPFAVSGLNILEEVNTTYKLGYSRTYLWNEVLWGFAD